MFLFLICQIRLIAINISDKYIHFFISIIIITIDHGRSINHRKLLRNERFVFGNLILEIKCDINEIKYMIKLSFVRYMCSMLP